MHTTDREGDVSAVLFERRELPPPAQERADSVYERLRPLAAAGELGSIDRVEWVKRTPVDACDCDVRDTYLEFSSWASEQGVRLSPFFDTRKCFTPEERDYTDWLVMPAFSLVVYEGDSVSAVYPHADDEESRTVMDGLARLEAAAADATAPEPTPAD